MLRKLLDWLYDRKTRRILRRACDGDLRRVGKAPYLTARQAEAIGRRGYERNGSA